MLRELHIKNVAVIEDVTVTFEDGFHVLTGETGAGKSILIDSINMALGERTDRDLIRTGAESASVDAVFEPGEEARKKLLELDIETEDGLLYISRQISMDGKSRCRLNGHMVPLGQLKEAAVLLLSIHGQNDNQSILSPKTHLDFLDSYGNCRRELEQYQEQYHKVLKIRKELSQLVTDEAEKERRLDLLKHQINEISAAALKDGEEEELLERREYLSHFETIIENTEKAYQALYGDESSESAYDQVSGGVHYLEKVAELDETLNGFYQTLCSVLADVEDVTRDLKSYLGNIDLEPGELDALEERLQVISDLKRKYGGSIAEVKTYLSTAESELAKIEDCDAERERLQTLLDKEEETVYAFAEELSKARQKKAVSLQTAIMNELADLDMQKMRFSVSVELMMEDEKPYYTKTGFDRVEFLISPNPGEALKPLTKIASGGEMSRIMLAIKSVLADNDPVDTMIFDEIDTGVSGRAAQRIAEKICMLAKNHQILCITHLAQIAGMADVHFYIEKNSDDEHTRTTVTPLSNDERKQELARIIGGVKITDLTLQAAQEMLDMASLVKGRR